MRAASSILYAAILLLTGVSAHAQYRTRNFNSLGGRRETPVNCMAQAYNGQVLAGSPEGVFLFDGKDSYNYAATYKQLKKNITAVFPSLDDVTWVGTSDGRVYCIRARGIDSVRLPGNEEKVTCFYETENRMFIGTNGQGLYELAGGVMHHYKDTCGLSDNVIYSINGAGKRFWCATDAGLTEVNLQGERPSFTTIGVREGIPDLIVRNIGVDAGRLILSMQDSGVCYYDLAKKKIRHITYFSGWSGGAVLDAGMVGGKLVIATEKEGLLVFPQSGDPLVINYSKTAGVNSIRMFMADREHQLWVATKRGLTQYVEKRYVLVDSTMGLVHPNVVAVATGRDGSCWIGRLHVSEKGPCMTGIIRDNNGEFLHKDLYGTHHAAVSCAASSPDGDIWYGTYGHGLIIVDPVTTNSVMINAREDGLANDNISHICFANDSTVYLSTLGSGLLEIHIEYNGIARLFRLVKNYTQKDGLGSDYVYATCAGNNGELFIATDGGGLQKLKNGKFSSLFTGAGIHSTTAFSVCRDRKGHIWCTSNADGIVLINGETVKTFGKEAGLRDVEPQQLVSEGDAVYALHARGIDRINIDHYDITYPDIAELGAEPNLNAVAVSDGVIYSGTTRGLLIYRVKAAASETVRPTVFISALQINFQPFPMDSITEFSASQNNLSFTFGGIWMKNPEKLLYRYKLQGLEEQWNYSDVGMTVTYNHLQPGAFTFIVQSRNEDDVWSDAQGYSFIINTPFWKRWWFWLITVVAFIAGTYIFVQYRLTVLRRKNLLLEEKVQLRTREIAEQSRVIAEKNLELEQLSLVASKTENVVLILNPEGELEYMNESFVKQSGMTLAEVRATYGKSIFELSNHPGIRDLIDEAVHKHHSVSYESLNTKYGNKTTWESTTLTPVYDDKDRLRKIVIIDTDVTERKRQEQVIVQKNKDITDSISYARKIQHAILPPLQQIKQHLPDSFVLYLTKDIVSGDFFWFAHMHDFSIIAAVDCTGHGVPGAFMSLIGYNLLNRIINENKIFDPSRILLELNAGVLGVLHKNESESKDGMDIAICKINHSSGLVEYAGAMRPMWVVNQGVLTEVKADKIPIGTKQNDRSEEIAYRTQQIQSRPGDRFYIFTDGFADQFGGSKDKKYSTARFKDLLTANAHLPFDQQLENVRHSHLEWKGDNEQVDDILVIGFAVTA